MMTLNINKSFWERGDFPQVINNGSEYIALKDPWANGSTAAPFDKRMFWFVTLVIRKLIRRWDSFLSDPQPCRRWNERVVPGWFRREALVGRFT